MMKKTVLALLRTMMLVALVPVLSVSLVACDPENGGGTGNGGEEDGTEDTTSEIAVTGLVDKFGCTYADISGYANLNLLPVGSGNPVIGVEVVEAKAETNDNAVQATAGSLIGNIFKVSFCNLSPATEYKYRSFVTYGGITYYANKYNTFTTENIPEGAVDLGLSVLWASCNVGATTPEEYGDYFAWGETTPKSSYTESNSVTYGLSISELKSRGIIGADGNLTAAYDAATANWGDNWRMPTLDEMKELFDRCTWEWITQNGVNGRKVTGPNGNSIFLPAAGSRDNTSLYNAGYYGGYWSATPYSNSSRAFFLYFYDFYYDWSSRNRYDGLAVRPVSE